MMQTNWDPYREQSQRQAPKFTEDEITAFIEEVSAARDREAFNAAVSRFDSQIIAKFKARFPTQTGKFPFGSAGKPYSYSNAPVYNPPPTYQAQTYYQPQYPTSYPTSTDRPQSAMLGRSMGEGFNQPIYPPDMGFSTSGYQVRTPSPQRIAVFNQRPEVPYTTPMYDRGGAFQPDVRTQPGYQDRRFMEKMPEAQYSQFGTRTQGMLSPSYGTQPGLSKGVTNSLADYSDLRKMKEDMLSRFASSGGQRPPRS